MGISGAKINTQATPDLLDRVGREIDGGRVKVPIESKAPRTEAPAALSSIPQFSMLRGGRDDVESAEPKREGVPQRSPEGETRTVRESSFYLRGLDWSHFYSRVRTPQSPLQPNMNVGFRSLPDWYYRNDQGLQVKMTFVCVGTAGPSPMAAALARGMASLRAADQAERRMLLC